MQPEFNSRFVRRSRRSFPVGEPAKPGKEECDMITTFSDEIVLTLPHLRAYARMVARDRVLADDLVQETVLRALVHADQFRPGTNLKAWLKTILRNSYINEKRSEKRQAQYAAGFAGESAAVRGEQEGHVELNDCARAFATGRVSIYQLVLSKPDHGNANLPLTRADWYIGGSCKVDCGSTEAD